MSDDPQMIAGPVDVPEFLALASKAYGWTTFTNGEVAGLVAGDMGYDGCNTKWGDLISCAMWTADRETMDQINEKLVELADLCRKALSSE